MKKSFTNEWNMHTLYQDKSYQSSIQHTQEDQKVQNYFNMKNQSLKKQWPQHNYQSQNQFQFQNKSIFSQETNYLNHNKLQKDEIGQIQEYNTQNQNFSGMEIENDSIFKDSIDEVSQQIQLQNTIQLDQSFNKEVLISKDNLKYIKEVRKLHQYHRTQEEIDEGFISFDEFCQLFFSWKDYMLENIQLIEQIYTYVKKYYLDINYSISPRINQIFKPFELTNVNNLKVVILQDRPLNFSVKQDEMVQRERKPSDSFYSGFPYTQCCQMMHQDGMILKFYLHKMIALLELNYSKNLRNKDPYELVQSWARQGVLGISDNIMYYRKVDCDKKEKVQNESQYKLMIRYQDHIIDIINKNFHGIIFLLQDVYAWRNFSKKIDQKKHLIICTYPIQSERYYESNPFRIINNCLKIQNKKEINWLE